MFRQSGLHGDPDLGVHRQILLDWIPFAAHSRAGSAFRSHLPAQVRVQRGFERAFGGTSAPTLTLAVLAATEASSAAKSASIMASSPFAAWLQRRTLDSRGPDRSKSTFEHFQAQAIHRPACDVSFSAAGDPGFADRV